jgi:Ser/Thr protein kinase RdoA (MazF antagonist)
MQDAVSELPRIPLPRTSVNKMGTQPGGGTYAKLPGMDHDENPSSPEEPLPGTFSTLAKVGDTVRRSTGPRTPAVHALLRHLEGAGFDGAPRVLGVDARGREVLTFLPGYVPRSASPDVATDRALSEVGRLLRRYHEAVSGFTLPSGIGWYGGADHDPGAGSVVCHNDLAPRNTVFREGSPVAFLDFDLASPAQPSWDVAHLAWQFVPLADDGGCARQGWSSPPDRPGRLRLLCDGYGLSERERIGLPELLALRMEASASGIEALADEGVPVHRRWAEEGVPALIRDDRDWVERHREILREALLRD